MAPTNVPQSRSILVRFNTTHRYFLVWAIFSAIMFLITNGFQYTPVEGALIGVLGSIGMASCLGARSRVRVAMLGISLSVMGYISARRFKLSTDSGEDMPMNLVDAVLIGALGSTSLFPFLPSRSTFKSLIKTPSKALSRVLPILHHANYHLYINLDIHDPNSIPIKTSWAEACVAAFTLIFVAFPVYSVLSGVVGYHLLLLGRYILLGEHPTKYAIGCDHAVVYQLTGFSFLWNVFIVPGGLAVFLS